MNSEQTIKDIINGKKNLLTPIFNGLAYLDIEVTDKNSCMIKLGDNYYVKTKLTKANDIVKRIKEEKSKNDYSINKLDENTFEIRENIIHHKEIKKEDNKKQNNTEDIEERKKRIMEENKKILEEINNQQQDKPSPIKRIKLKSKEDIVNIVLNKLNAN